MRCCLGSQAQKSWYGVVRVAKSTAVVPVPRLCHTCGLITLRSSRPHILGGNVCREKGKILFSPQREETSGQCSPHLGGFLGIAKPAAANRVGILKMKVLSLPALIQLPLIYAFLFLQIYSVLFLLMGQYQEFKIPD